MPRPPNLIFILCDDLGWRDTGCSGSTFYETPHIDRLATEGMRFEQAYAAAPVCSPTRASVLTGKYPARVGVTDWIGAHARGRLIDAPYIDHLPESERSIATVLGEAGYQTWHVGKWHLGGPDSYPDRRGFDCNIGGCHWGQPKQGYRSPWGIETVDDAAPGTFIDEHLTDRALALIRAREGRPFYLNFCPYLVHTPLEAPEDLVEHFRRKQRSLGLDGVDPFIEGDFFPCEHKRDQRIRRRLLQSDPVYAAMVALLDQQVGRLVDGLRAEGILEETVIVFTSDNGGLATAEGSPTCNLPASEGKGWLADGGNRVPLIVRAPGLTRAGATSQLPVSSPDFFPTLLELADVPLEPEQHVDGRSLLPALRGDDCPELQDRPLFWHYPHYGNQGGTPGSAIRQGRWKLTEDFETGRLQLFDLQRDVAERVDLAGMHPERVQSLHALLRDWRTQVSAAMPTANPDFAD